MEHTLEQLKTLHNVSLSNARTSAQEALKYREEIVARCPSLRGPSVGHIQSGVERLFLAKTFANTPFDLPAEDNPHR